MSSAPSRDTNFFCQGAGEMRARCRTLDWATTKLGAVVTWSPSLRTAAQMMLASPFPNIILWGPDLIQLYNDGYRALMGNKHPAGLGQSTQQCWPEVWHINQPIYQRVWAGESFSFADALYPITRSGQLEDAWFTLAYSPVLDELGQVGGILVTVVETTNRLQQEQQQQQALRKSDEKYRTLFESMDEAFCLIEVLFDQGGQAFDYQFLETNPAFIAQFGLDAIEGKTKLERAPDQEKIWFEMFSQVACTGQPVRFEYQAQAIPLPGWYDLYAFRIGAPQERMVALLSNNISQRKRTEEQQREADRRKDEFLAMLAHELRNPLAPVRNGLQLLTQTHPDDPLLGTILPPMNRQMEHLMRLVDDLLDVSRISQGKIALRTERIDLTQLMAQTVEAMRPQFIHSGRQFSVQLPDHSLYLNGDAARLNQVVVNLLTNGLRYTHPAGQVWLSLAPVGEQAVLRVSDNGIGLAADQLEAIFELFVQVNSSLARSNDGLGLGLALVRELVQLHGGRVEAHSPGLDQGSEFVIYLPLPID